MLCTNYTCVLQIALFYLVNIDMGEGGSSNLEDRFSIKCIKWTRFAQVVSSHFAPDCRSKNSARRWERRWIKQWKRKQRLNDWKLYIEKQQHGLSKTLPRNELKDLVIRQNTATQTLLKTKCMVRENAVSQTESRKTAGSCLTNVFDFLFENPLNKMYVFSLLACFLHSLQNFAYF